VGYGPISFLGSEKVQKYWVQIINPLAQSQEKDTSTSKALPTRYRTRRVTGTSIRYRVPYQVPDTSYQVPVPQVSVSGTRYKYCGVLTCFYYSKTPSIDEGTALTMKFTDIFSQPLLYCRNSFRKFINFFIYC
jgi:hypothetical protein